MFKSCFGMCLCGCFSGRGAFGVILGPNYSNFRYGRGLDLSLRNPYIFVYVTRIAECGTTIGMNIDVFILLYRRGKANGQNHGRLFSLAGVYCPSITQLGAQCAVLKWALSTRMKFTISLTC